MIISKEELIEKIKTNIEFTEHLKEFPFIFDIFIRQCEKESNYFIYATRYERHLNDASFGLFQLLTSTIKWLGFKGEIVDIFNPDVQVLYAIKYVDYLYSRFGEIKNKYERLSMAFASFNAGIGNINKALKAGLKEEEIFYEGKNTIQGSWATYENVVKMFKKYNIISERNVDINSRYVNYIMGVEKN